MSSSDPVADAGLPDINDRLVEPETPYEICDGVVVHVSPADPPHGKRHSQLCALIEAHTGPEFESAADLLTRTSRSDDIAPDVSVFPAAPDPATGGRQLEHLAFEIVSKQSLRSAGKNAAKLARRGVRRVFAIETSGLARSSGPPGPAPGASSTRLTTSPTWRLRFRCPSQP